MTFQIWVSIKNILTIILVRNLSAEICKIIVFILKNLNIKIFFILNTHYIGSTVNNKGGDIKIRKSKTKELPIPFSGELKTICSL